MAIFGNQNTNSIDMLFRSLEITFALKNVREVNFGCQPRKKMTGLIREFERSCRGTKCGVNVA
jgi:hypothetical protein